MKALNYDRRIVILKEMLEEDKTQTEIAKACGVHRNTIVKDFKKWKETDDFELWLHEEYFRLHGRVKKTNHELAYKEVNKLLLKTMTSKFETSGELKTIVEWRAYKPDNQNSDEHILPS